ncbi:MAG: hypothetical protein RLZZ26_523 [Candidatus Parcubacteria bacterium]|jgi:putative transcriptional regulator
MQSVTNNVQKYRNGLDLTQEQLAEKAAVTRQTIIAIEKGNYTPSVLLALKLAKIFKTSVDDLFHLV